MLVIVIGVFSKSPSFACLSVFPPQKALPWLLSGQGLFRSDDASVARDPRDEREGTKQQFINSCLRLQSLFQKGWSMVEAYYGAEQCLTSLEKVCLWTRALLDRFSSQASCIRLLESSFFAFRTTSIHIRLLNSFPEKQVKVATSFLSCILTCWWWQEGLCLQSYMAIKLPRSSCHSTSLICLCLRPLLVMNWVAMLSLCFRPISSKPGQIVSPRLGHGSVSTSARRSGREVFVGKNLLQGVQSSLGAPATFCGCFRKSSEGFLSSFLKLGLLKDGRYHLIAYIVGSWVSLLNWPFSGRANARTSIFGFEPKPSTFGLGTINLNIFGGEWLQQVSPPLVLKLKECWRTLKD